MIFSNCISTFVSAFTVVAKKTSVFLWLLYLIWVYQAHLVLHTETNAVFCAIVFRENGTSVKTRVYSYLNFIKNAIKNKIRHPWGKAISFRVWWARLNDKSQVSLSVTEFMAVRNTCCVVNYRRESKYCVSTCISNVSAVCTLTHAHARTHTTRPCVNLPPW